MFPHKPENWPQVFEEHLNAGDLNAHHGVVRPGSLFYLQLW